MHKDFRGECIYQAETDVHFPQLTVSQTLEFAARAKVIKHLHIQNTRLTKIYKAPHNRLPGVSRDVGYPLESDILY